MKKLMILLVIGLMVTAPAAIGAASTVSVTAPVSVNQIADGTNIIVGFLSPQTGGLSQYSPPFVNAAMLAGAHLNDSTSFNWIIKVYDTQTTETGATAAMTQAVTDGAVYVAGAAGSSNTLAAAAIAKQEQVPLISYASTSPDLTTFDDGGYLFRVVASDAFQGQADSDIARAGGFETAVILNVDNAYGNGIADKFDSAFTEAGGEILASIPYDDETKTDFSSEISTIQAQQPDVIFAVSYATDGSNLFTQMADQNIDIPVIGTDGIADNAIFDEQTGTEEAMAGFIATKPTSIETDAVTDFNDAYDAAYPGESGIFIAEAYDSVMAGANAVIEADSTEGSDIIAALAGLDYAGASGQVKFDSNGDVLGAVYEILEVQDTGFEAVGLWNGGELTWSDSDFESRYVVEEPGNGDNAGTPFPLVGMIAALGAFVTIVQIRRKRD